MRKYFIFLTNLSNKNELSSSTDATEQWKSVDRNLTSRAGWPSASSKKIKINFITCIPHCSKVDNSRDPSKILQNNPSRSEGDLHISLMFFPCQDLLYIFFQNLENKSKYKKVQNNLKIIPALSKFAHFSTITLVELSHQNSFAKSHNCLL